MINNETTRDAQGGSLCLGCSQPLGMITGGIPDFALTASSAYNKWHRARYGRLYSHFREKDSYGWRPSRNAIGEWLQVDLGTVVTVTKIATQGKYKSKYMLDGFVKQYDIKFSKDGTNFEQHENKEVLDNLYCFAVLCSVPS